MKKIVPFLMALLFCGALFVACGDGGQATEEATDEATEMVDSISREVEEAADSLKDAAEEVGEAVDSLLDEAGNGEEQ